MLLAMCVAACNSYNSKQNIEGFYEHNDTLGAYYSSVKLYANNYYKVISVSCFYSTFDTGIYKIEDSTISFKSIILKSMNDNNEIQMPLNDFVLMYNNECLILYRDTVIADGRQFTDTFYWIKQKEVLLTDSL